MSEETKTAEEKAMELFPHVCGDKSSENFTKYHIWLAGHRYSNKTNAHRLYPDETVLDLAIQEIEKQKFNLNVNKLPATKVGLTDALNVLQHLKEEHYIKCECGHEVEHKFSHTNEDGQVTCSTCVIDQQQSANAELKKKNEELVELHNSILACLDRDDYFGAKKLILKHRLKIE